MPPCSGVKVLDLSHGYGSISSMLLSDYGAEVVKVEPPGGEAFRSMSAFLQWNRGKRSRELDLTTADGRARIADASTWADVVIHNLRPQTATALGIDYPTLSARNPRLVHLSISWVWSD